MLTLIQGFTYISEDSSEITFLLVENYYLTTPIGPRPGREFLAHVSTRDISPFFIALVSW